MTIALSTWIAAGAIAAAVTVAGVQTVRLSGEQAAHAKTVADHATAGEKAAERALALQQERDKARDDLATALSSIDTRQNAKLKDAENENSRLNSCLRRGTCGLRVAAVCPIPGSVMPTAATGGGVDSGAGARLDAGAEPAYLAVRSGINRVQTKLAACQQSLSVLTGQVTKPED